MEIVVEKVSLDVGAIRQRQKEVISFFGKTSLWSSHTLFIKVVKIVVSDIVESGIYEEGHIKAIIGQRWRLIQRKCLEYIEDMRKHYGRM